MLWLAAFEGVGRAERGERRRSWILPLQVAIYPVSTLCFHIYLDSHVHSWAGNPSVTLLMLLFFFLVGEWSPVSKNQIQSPVWPACLDRGAERRRLMGCGRVYGGHV